MRIPLKPAEFYKEYGDSWLQPRRREVERIRSRYKSKVFLELLKRNKIRPKSILDFGCGHGNVLAILGLRTKAEKLVGIDISESMLKVAKRAHPKCRFYLGNEDFFEKGKINNYDLVLFSDILEHLENPKSVLEKAKNKTRNILINVPLEKFIFHIKREPRRYSAEGHLHDFSKSSFFNLLDKAEVKIIDSIVSFPPESIAFHPFILDSLKKSEGFRSKVKFFLIKNLIMKIPYFLVAPILAWRNGKYLFVLCRKK